MSTTSIYTPPNTTSCYGQIAPFLHTCGSPRTLTGWSAPPVTGTFHSKNVLELSKKRGIDGPPCLVGQFVT
jgi:hypothetical protein